MEPTFHALDTFNLEISLPFINTLIARISLLLALVASVGAFASAQSSPQSSSGSTVTAAINHLYRSQLSTGEAIYDTLLGVRLQGASRLAAPHSAHGQLIGATALDGKGTNKLVYFDSSRSALAVSFYGGSAHETFLAAAPLTTLGAGWTAQAVADLKGDGNLDVIVVDKSTGEVGVYSFGGATGTSLLKREMFSPLSVSGWNVIGAADLNADGHPDLILQNRSTRQIMAAYLGGPNGTTVTSTHNLESSEFVGWTAAGMQDMNGDGHPDLILVNDVTGESIVNYYAGDMGFTYQRSAYLDASGSRDWKLVVPTSSASATTSTATVTDNASTSASTSVDGATTDSTAPLQLSGTVPILIYNGSGTSSTDVTAVEAVVTSMGLSYKTANSSQLNAMTSSQLLAYKLFLMPGGNAISISGYLTKNATTAVHDAVHAGLNYLGICAGGFFGGSSAYHNYSNLTSGRWFNVWSNYGKGIGKEAVSISFPSGTKLDIYWQDGPDLSGWGSVVAKYPTGAPAITEGYWGSGFVLFSAIHPEAPASWRYGMSFFTPLDVDLTYARTLVSAALNRTMLPHY
jgi:hypothetical protein